MTDGDNMPEPSPRRLSVYDDAPIEHVPPKPWTDLPREDREKYLVAHPRTARLIVAGFVFALWVVTIGLVWLDYGDAKPHFSRYYQMILFAWTGWVFVLWQIFYAFKAKK